MDQKESSNRRRWWQVRPLFEKLYLTYGEDEEREEEQSRVRRRSAPAKRVMRR